MTAGETIQGSSDLIVDLEFGSNSVFSFPTTGVEPGVKFVDVTSSCMGVVAAASVLGLFVLVFFCPSWKAVE